jgi:hypothetical protein
LIAQTWEDVSFQSTSKEDIQERRKRAMEQELSRAAKVSKRNKVDTYSNFNVEKRGTSKTKE